MRVHHSDLVVAGALQETCNHATNFSSAEYENILHRGTVYLSSDK